MKVNFSAVITDLYDRPLKESADQNSPDATLAHVCISALLGADKLSPTDKLRAFDLALKVKDGNSVEVTAEESAFIQSRIGEMFNPLIVGRSTKLLNG